MKEYLKEHDMIIIFFFGLIVMCGLIIWHVWNEYHHPKVCVEYEEVEVTECTGHFYHYCAQYEKKIEKQCKKYKTTK